MRTPHWLIVVVISFVCGIGIGVLWPQAQPTTPGQGAPAQQETISAPAGVEPLKSATAGSDKIDRPDDPAQPAPTIVKPAPESLELGPADGRIAARFVDHDGAPVEGVACSLRLNATGVVKGVSRKAYATDDDYIRARVEQYYRQLLREQALTRSAVSDADGWVRFESLPGERATLTAAGGSHLFERGRQTLGLQVAMGEELTITVARAVSIEVLVTSIALDEGHKCRVTWSARGMSGSVEARTGKAAELLVPAGPVEFRAGAANLDSMQVTEINTAGARVEINLGGQAYASGTVRFLGARPPDFTVRVARPIAGVADTDLLLLHQGGIVDDIRVDPASGRFVLGEGYEGQHVIGVVAGAQVLVSTRVTLGAAAQEIVLEVAAPDTSNALIVNIEVPEGTKLGNERLSISKLSSGNRIRFSTWIESATRQVLVYDLDQDPLPETARLSLRLQSLGLLELVFSPRTDREVTLKFVPACVLRLEVEGWPSDARMVNLRTAPGPEFERWDMWPLRRPGPHTDDRPLGRFQPGEYRFRLVADHPAPWVLAEVSVTLQAGEKTLAMEIPKLHPVLVDGSACSPYPHAKLRQVETGVVGHITFSERNQVLVGGLPPGTYEVTYTANGIRGEERKTTFTVPGTELVQLE